MTPAVFAVSAAGRATAKRIADLLGAPVEQGEAAALVPRFFAEGRPIVGVCAAGILIRLVAPLLADKRSEPPILAVSTDGRHVVPLLGGHNGANRLARDIALGIGGTAALTTASESLFAFSLDEPPPGYRLANPEAAKAAMAAVLAGAALRVEGEGRWLAEAGYAISPQGTVSVEVTDRTVNSSGLVYHPVDLIAGVGCARGTPADEIVALVGETLAGAGLAPASLAALASIDIKADEPGLLEAAERLGVPLRLFSADELRAEAGRVPNPSALVEAETGTPSVAEAAALKAGELIVPKRKSINATCAVGRSHEPLQLTRFGRGPGVLHIVGIGPGAPETRTASAVAALAASDDWVGYGPYLDIVGDLRRGQTEHRFALGEEEARVHHALELAGAGRTVALVSSGDAQIYAMAGLALELIDAPAPRGVSAAARRIGLHIYPGISALQAASAAAGALIGHDFCAVSLSDLMTPREAILARLEAAARADFVAALYNPRSTRRTDLIEAARAIFLTHRPPETPVVVARNLGRRGERVETTTLAAFDPETVDMLTTVLVGATSSRLLTRPNGSRLAYTPRGYAKKSGGAP